LIRVTAALSDDSPAPHATPPGLSSRWRYLLLVGFALQCVLSMTQKSATYDEWGFITSGVQLLRPSLGLTGWDRMKLVNPPVGRLPGALPVALIRLEAPATPAAEPTRRDTTLAREALKLLRTKTTFPFSWRADPRRLLLLSRLPTVFEGIALGLIVAWWAGMIGGRGAQTAALLLYCFCPNMLAHSRLATVDVAASLGFLGAAALAGRALLRGGSLRLGTAGLIMALALQTKLSAHLLLPLVFLGGMVAWRLERITLAQAMARAATIGLIGVALNWLLYGLSLSGVAAGTRYGADWSGDLAGWPGMAYRAYRTSLSLVETSKMKGYLAGHHYWDRHWAYYPIAVAVKTPLGALTLASVAVGLFLRLGRARGFWRWWTVLPPALLVAAAATRGLNVGLRHILPAYPFMHAGAGAALAWLWRRRGGARGLSVVAGASCLVAALSAYPHYLAYFNRASGGPDRGYRLLVDSNLDWGQDLPALAACQAKGRIPSLRLSYFGTDLPEAYGVIYSLPSEQEAYRPHAGWYAVSATTLQGLYSYPDLDRWAWLRRRKPVAKAGHTIFLFHVRPWDGE
jgi:hypothetical protein